MLPDAVPAVVETVTADAVSLDVPVTLEEDEVVILGADELTPLTSDAVVFVVSVITSELGGAEEVAVIDPVDVALVRVPVRVPFIVSSLFRSYCAACSRAHYVSST